MKETFSSPEEAKRHIKKLVPRGYFDSKTKYITGYTKYGNKEIGYRYVPNFKYVKKDGTFGKSRFELRQKDFDEHFRNKFGLPRHLSL